MRFQQPAHADAAERARQTPGVFVLVNVYPARMSADSVVRSIRAGRGPVSYRPAADYEAYAARHDDGTALWVRYAAGLVKDDANHVCDRWENSCGVSGDCAAVLTEAHRERPAPAAPNGTPLIKGVEGGVFAAVVDLIAEEDKQRRSMHASNAAHIAEQHGHTGAAQIIRSQMRANGGHMSAKHAAHYLVQLDLAARIGGEWEDGRISYEADTVTGNAQPHATAGGDK